MLRHDVVWQGWAGRKGGKSGKDTLRRLLQSPGLLRSTQESVLGVPLPARVGVPPWASHTCRLASVGTPSHCVRTASTPGVAPPDSGPSSSCEARLKVNTCAVAGLHFQVHTGAGKKSPHKGGLASLKRLLQKHYL